METFRLAGDNNRLYFKNFDRRPDDEEFAEVMKILKEEGAIISDKYIHRIVIGTRIVKLVKKPLMESSRLQKTITKCVENASITILTKTVVVMVLF